MEFTIEEMAGGLTPDHELFFQEQPHDPEMRESTSVWLFEENGEFGFPRIGIEAIASSWRNRVHQANFALGGGRILDGLGVGEAPSPLGPDGRATIFGAGPLVFRCIEPFRRWSMSFDGTAADGTVQQQISRTLDRDRRIPVGLEAELEMATPAWTHDYPPDKMDQLTEAERAEGDCIGYGWRLEHTLRGRGILTVDGTKREFTAVGSRIKRQSVRPLTMFRGHCWQSALFPDGRAFGFMAFPPTENGDDAYNAGYIFQGGKSYPARARKIPWLQRLVGEGDDVSIELESEVGTVCISATTALTTFRIMSEADGLPMAFNLHQGGARYTWDGMTTYGMIERSCRDDQLVG